MLNGNEIKKVIDEIQDIEQLKENLDHLLTSLHIEIRRAHPIPGESEVKHYAYIQDNARPYIQDALEVGCKNALTELRKRYAKLTKASLEQSK